MRSDYLLYLVAVILFVITAISYIALQQIERSLSMVTTVILGLLFIALGYTQRPRISRPITSLVVPNTQPPAAVMETPKPIQETPVAAVVETQSTPAVAKPTADLTVIKGIKAKRAEQLRSLGINNAEDLANASPIELAAKLRIAPYFTEKWVTGAKELVER